MSGNDIDNTKLDNVNSDLPPEDENLKKVENCFTFPTVVPMAQGNGDRSIKSLLFNNDQEKEDYAKQYFAVQKIQNQYIKYK